MLGKHQHRFVQRLRRDVEGDEFLRNGAADFFNGVHRCVRRQYGQYSHMYSKGQPACGLLPFALTNDHFLLSPGLRALL
ncbi:hypothetical protein [Pseudomonas sp. FSL R10-0399]|uniref:hypothetical protein n=1 Tax=Pseudomonas sp. FSL R10-0399 TaxID=2662194 RepID=UPI002114BABA|nr:hypothetical protein [Pseudomonas sp. FSL R10-0399]